MGHCQDIEGGAGVRSEQRAGCQQIQHCGMALEDNRENNMIGRSECQYRPKQIATSSGEKPVFPQGSHKGNHVKPYQITYRIESMDVSTGAADASTTLNC